MTLFQLHKKPRRIADLRQQIADVLCKPTESVNENGKLIDDKSVQIKRATLHLDSFKKLTLMHGPDK